MAKFIEVTDQDGKMLVNIESIIYIQETDSIETVIEIFNDKTLFVQEPYKEIKSKLEIANAY
ncbi:flagellar FlbD family protein [Gilliamella sp. B3486]|uniref:flagellar FlbD family protein n=1 Tax=unclassified Gilliamella TaxID=2685620 RepID=UPI002269FA8A|nr:MULTISPECIES: flagellar FlbD family protein [unclassified Gilliamella]MCX8596769.1 flagellar FlbD family protein [Gilliamella sp. B3493]MCX8598497.1 flagellar FlbD family protein [Gilliamella sp. B3486]MCX8704484.1 flagellar FlbD family protein [Gilliamella sp. B3127]